MQRLPFFVALLIFVCVSCVKELVTENHPEFVGHWITHPKAGMNHHIYIYESGKAMFLTNGEQEVYPYYDESHTRKMYFAKDKLLFGKSFRNAATDGRYNYSIDTYPTVAGQDFTDGANTVSEGQTYTILSGKVYVRL